MFFQILRLGDSTEYVCVQVHIVLWEKRDLVFRGQTTSDLALMKLRERVRNDM